MSVWGVWGLLKDSADSQWQCLHYSLRFLWINPRGGLCRLPQISIRRISPLWSVLCRRRALPTVSFRSGSRIYLSGAVCPACLEGDGILGNGPCIGKARTVSLQLDLHRIPGNEPRTSSELDTIYMRSCQHKYMICFIWFDPLHW